MKKMDVKQLELDCDDDAARRPRSPDEELMQRIDKVISDTTNNVRPYLNRMVKDVERLLEGSFIRTPDSNVLDDMVGGLEKNIRKFVKEVIALKQWNKPSPPHSSSE
jgi:hypothetical protein